MKSVVVANIIAFLLLFSLPASAQTPPSVQEIASYTGLHAAAYSNDAGLIAKHIANGANPEKLDYAGRTSVHIAAHNSSHEALRALVLAGANIRAFDKQRYDAVTIAAVNNDVKMVRLAIELGGDAEAVTSPYDGTALIAAAHLGHVEVVKALITAGSPLDHINNLGWTAMIEAVVLGDGGNRHISIVKSLLSAGADRFLADRSGRTPYQLALQYGFDEMSSVLKPQ